jgi:hypothetical protein
MPLLRLNACRARRTAPFLHLRFCEGAHFFWRIGYNLGAECLVAFHHAWRPQGGADIGIELRQNERGNAGGPQAAAKGSAISHAVMSETPSGVWGTIMRIARL